MPQVLAKRPHRLLPIVLLLAATVALPARAYEESPSPWRRVLSSLPGWLGTPLIALWLAETQPVGGDDDTPVDNGGASMDPAGRPPGSTGGAPGSGSGTGSGTG